MRRKVRVPTVPARLQIGDRVRLIQAISGVAAETRGIILRSFPRASLYEVRFDGHPTAHTVSLGALAPAPQEDTGRGKHR
jgi:hypothetical protein